MPQPASLQPGPGRSRSSARGWTTAGWIPTAASASSSTARSCPDGADARPRWPRCWLLLYLHGLSSSDFVPALEELFGSAAGLSASVVTRLTSQWQAEREAFAQRDLSEVDYVYCWADGVHFSIRLGEQGRLCCLVIVGVRADGGKELVAVAAGTRESTDDWAELLRDLRRRGMGAPVVMVGDGALGLWRALREVFPATREQRCWVHVVRNVLGALPKSVHPGARRALNEIILAEDRSHAERAIDAFAADYGVKWPKAVAKVTGETERLLCFFDYPAEHWVHLRTTNPIESSFSPVRARTRVTKGPGTKDMGLAMVFKLLQAAEGRWRAVNGPHLVALVRAGASFEAGKLIERPDESPDKEAHEDVTKVAA
jgi:transposase-like protein